MRENLNKDLLKKIGNISQIAGVRRIEFSSGPGRGTEAYEVYNETGIRFTVLADMCMDILDLQYKGINLGFMTKNGLQNNRFFNALDKEFNYYWRGGMLCTCGLSNAGIACVDEGFYRTEHGRIGMMPAENLSVYSGWKNDDYIIELEGEIRESMLYGYNLQLKRKISTSLKSKEIHIKDVVQNLEPGDTEFMLLYHFNFGFPLLDEGAVIVKPEGEITPWKSNPDDRTDNCLKAETPRDGCEEETYYHENIPDEDGWAYSAIINPDMELGAYLKYKYENLPCLIQWKSMRSHDYAMGLEPSNSYILGRVHERENNTIPRLRGYEKKEYDITLGILDSKHEISDFEQMIKRINQRV